MKTLLNQKYDKHTWNVLYFSRTYRFDINVTKFRVNQMWKWRRECQMLVSSSTICNSLSYKVKISLSIIMDFSDDSCWPSSPGVPLILTSIKERSKASSRYPYLFSTLDPDKRPPMFQLIANQRLDLSCMFQAMCTMFLKNSTRSFERLFGI